MFVQRSYKHLLVLTSEEETVFSQYAGCKRLIYNLALEQRKMAYRKSDYKPVSLNAVTQSYEITELKEYARQNEEWAFLLEVPAVIYQQALKDLDKAYQNFYRGGGYPRFMSKGRKESFRFPNPTDVITNDPEYPNQIRLPKIGWVRVRNCWSKLGDGLLYEGELKNTTVKHETDGWYVIFNCEVVRTEPKVYLPGTPVGIDLGIAQSLTMSTPDSEPLHVPVITRKECKHLQKVQSEISRKQSGSNNQKKQRAYLNSLFKRYANRKQDYLHKLTTQLTRDAQHEIIVLEDLRIKNMTASAKGTIEEPGTNVAQKAGLNREILNQSWGLTRRLLEYKSLEYGNQLVLVNPAYTSQECSSCGYSNKDNRPEQAVFNCLKCGVSMNADVNAAQNILNRGLEQLKTDDLYSKKARAEFKREQRILREQERTRKLEARAEAMRKRAEKRLLKKAVQERLTNTLEEALKQKTIRKPSKNNTGMITTSKSKDTNTVSSTTNKNNSTNDNTNTNTNTNTAAGIVVREARSSKAYPTPGRLPGDSKAHSLLSEETSKNTVTNTNQIGVSNTTLIIKSQQTHNNPSKG